MRTQMFLLFVIIMEILVFWFIKRLQGKRAVFLLVGVTILNLCIPMDIIAKATSENAVISNGKIWVDDKVSSAIGRVTYRKITENDKTNIQYQINNDSNKRKVREGDVVSFSGTISAPEGKQISWVRIDVYDASTKEPYTVGEEYYYARNIDARQFELSSIPSVVVGEAFGNSAYKLTEGHKYIVMFFVGDSSGNGFADEDGNIKGNQGPAILLDVKYPPENCDHPHAQYEYILHSSGEKRTHSYGEPLTHQIEPLYERYCGRCGIFLMNIWGQGTPEEHTINENGMCVMCGFVIPEYFEETDGDYTTSDAPVYKFGKYMTLEDFGIATMRKSSDETYLNRQTIRPTSSYYGYKWIANRPGYRYPFTASFQLDADYMPQNSVYIAIANYDCDEEGDTNCCEYDQVYINGKYVGVLTGENNTSNTTLLKVDRSFLKSGTNEIVIYVGNKIKRNGYQGNAPGTVYRDDPYSYWWLRVDDIQILCDGGSSEGRPDVFRVNINKAEITNNRVKCYVTTQIEDSENRSFKLEYALYDWSNEESATYGQIIDDDFATIYSSDYSHEGTLTMPVNSMSGTYTAVVYLKQSNGNILAYDEESFEYETGILPSFDVQNYKAVPAHLNWTNQNVEINLSADIDPNANLKNLQFYLSDDVQSEANVDLVGHVTGTLSISENGLYNIALRYTKDGKNYSKTTKVEINNIDKIAPVIEFVKNADNSVTATYHDDKSGMSDARYCISYDSNKPADSIYIPLESGAEIVYDIYPYIHYILKDRAGNINSSYYLAGQWGSLDQPVITAPENGSTVYTLDPIVKWNAVLNATSYRLYMRDVTNGSNQNDDSTLMFPKEGILVDGNTRQLDIAEHVVPGKSIQSGRKYNIAVQAINPQYNSAISHVSFSVLIVEDAYLNLYIDGVLQDTDSRVINAMVYNHGGDGTPIIVDSNMDWTVSTDAGWIKLIADKNKNQILHSYEPNTYGDSRTAQITVSAPACEDWTISVTQGIIPLVWSGRVGGDYNRYALVDLTYGALNPNYTYELQVYDDDGNLIKTKKATERNVYDYYKDLGMMRGKRYRLTVKETDQDGILINEYKAGILQFDYYLKIDQVRSGETPVTPGGVIYSGNDISFDWTGSSGYGAEITVTIGSKTLKYKSKKSGGTVIIPASQYEQYLTSDQTDFKIVLDVEGQKSTPRKHVIIKAGQMEDAMIYTPDNGEMIRVFDGEEIVVTWSPIAEADYYKVQFGWCNPSEEIPELIKSFHFDKDDLLKLVITKADFINLLKNSGISELLSTMPDNPEEMMYELEFLIIACKK